MGKGGSSKSSGSRPGPGRSKSLGSSSHIYYNRYHTSSGGGSGGGGKGALDAATVLIILVSVGIVLTIVYYLSKLCDCPDACASDYEINARAQPALLNSGVNRECSSAGNNSNEENEVGFGTTRSLATPRKYPEHANGPSTRYNFNVENERTTLDLRENLLSAPSAPSASIYIPLKPPSPYRPSSYTDLPKTHPGRGRGGGGRGGSRGSSGRRGSSGSHHVSFTSFSVGHGGYGGGGGGGSGGGGGDLTTFWVVVIVIIAILVILYFINEYYKNEDSDEDDDMISETDPLNATNPPCYTNSTCATTPPPAVNVTQVNINPPLPFVGPPTSTTETSSSGPVCPTSYSGVRPIGFEPHNESTENYRPGPSSTLPSTHIGAERSPFLSESSTYGFKASTGTSNLPPYPVAEESLPPPYDSVVGIPSAPLPRENR